MAGRPNGVAPSYDRRSSFVACRGAEGGRSAPSALRADGQVTLRDHLSYKRPKRERAREL